MLHNFMPRLSSSFSPSVCARVCCRACASGQNQVHTEDCAVLAADAWSNGAANATRRCSAKTSGASRPAKWPPRVARGEGVVSLNRCLALAFDGERHLQYHLPFA